jgi:hypothetical protein
MHLRVGMLRVDRHAASPMSGPEVHTSPLGAKVRPRRANLSAWFQAPRGHPVGLGSRRFAHTCLLWMMCVSGCAGNAKATKGCPFTVPLVRLG